MNLLTHVLASFSEGLEVLPVQRTTAGEAMPSFDLIKTILRELMPSESAPRIPEPDLVMDDPEKIAAFTRAGREDGVMAAVYLFHCAQVCEVISSGDTVLDLGCGPATQLAMIARLNPEVRFIGIDLSSEMVSRAQAHIASEDLTNVEIRQGDITNLDFLESKSADAIMSTVVFHHLPDERSLEETFIEIARVLKPGGGLYLVDFGRLKSAKSIDYFAHQYADSQPELFTLDYLYSLRAAFSTADFRRLTSLHLGSQARAYSTWPLSFMVAVKSDPRSRDKAAASALGALRAALPPNHKRDFGDLTMLFRLGGLRNTLL